MRAAGAGRSTARIAGSLLLLCLAYPGPEIRAASSRLRVAVTVPPQGWLVQRIGGEAVDVLTVVGAGESPATFQPTDAQVTALSRAALYFRIGVPAERGPWFRALKTNDELRIVDHRDDLVMRPMEDHSHSHGHEGHAHGDHEHGDEGTAENRDFAGLDPHVWLSPRRLITMTERVAQELAAADPERHSVYENGRARLVAELEALDAELRDRLTPLDGTTFIVFHPAWGYFADDYGLRQVAIEIDGKEPSEIELTRLAQEARELGARAIFVQPQITGHSARSIAAAVGADVVTIDPLAEDVAENLRRVAELLVDTAPPANRGQ